MVDERAQERLGELLSCKSEQVRYSSAVALRDICARLVQSRAKARRDARKMRIERQASEDSASGSNGYVSLCVITMLSDLTLGFPASNGIFVGAFSH